MGSGAFRIVTFFGSMAAMVAFQLQRDVDRKSHFWNYPPELFQTVLLAMFGLSADYFVVSYHYTTPPHPKFLLLLWRRFWIATHVISGSTEIFTLVTAFFAPVPDTWARVGATVGLCGHVMSAFSMLTMVFGQKSFMIPLYAFAILLHAKTAVALIENPASITCLLHCFLVLHIYAWVRVTIFVCKRLKAFRGYEYSFAIIVAGCISFPAVLGPTWNLGIIFLPMLYSFTVEPLLAVLGIKLWEDSAAEGRRERIAADRKKELAAAHSLALKTRSFSGHKGSRDTDEGRARAVFDFYDKDCQGQLDMDELVPVVRDLDLDVDEIKKHMAVWDTDKSGTVSFAEFYRHVWNFHGKGDMVSERAMNKAADSKVKPVGLTRSEKAKLIFDAIDADGSGALELNEVEALLTAWGVPFGEAKRALSKHDKNKDGMIDLAEFEASFAPVYEYGVNLLMNRPWDVTNVPS